MLSAVHKMTGSFSAFVCVLHTNATTKITDDVANRKSSLAACFAGDKMIKCILSPLYVQLLSVRCVGGPRLEPQSQRRGSC